jgi:hypothetical protein
MILRHPNARYLRDSPLPLIERNPLRFWKGAALTLAVGWAVSVWWLLR